jgi:hypothetical protein
MSGSNFTDEIKQSMQPNSRMMQKKKSAPKEGSAAEEAGESPAFERKEVAAGVDRPSGSRPPPHAAAPHNPNAVAAPPPPPHQFMPHSSGMTMPSVGQPAGVPAPHMGGPVPQQGSGLQQAHATIVNALAQRDRGGY